MEIPILNLVLIMVGVFVLGLILYHYISQRKLFKFIHQPRKFKHQIKNKEINDLFKSLNTLSLNEVLLLIQALYQRPAKVVLGVTNSYYYIDSIFPESEEVEMDYLSRLDNKTVDKPSGVG